MLQDNQETTPITGDGMYECLLLANVLTRKLQVVVDTGASYNIISFRSVKKLKLKSLMRPSKKAFITAVGELTFPVRDFSFTIECGRRHCESELSCSEQSVLLYSTKS